MSSIHHPKAKNHNAESDDAFWAVAFMGGDHPHRRHHSNDDSMPKQEDESEMDDDKNDDDFVETEMAMESDSPGGRLDRYVIPNSNGDTLTVRPLPLTDGIWSPLGADAWYGSALLCAYITNVHGTNNSAGDCPLQKRLAQPGDITALELGSGAVGLAGLAMAWQLQQQQQRERQTTTASSLSAATTAAAKASSEHHHRVILTDNDPALLRQLQQNVHDNLATIQPRAVSAETITTTVECHVAQLDWGQVIITTDSSHSSFQQSLLLQSSSLLLGCRLDIIFGSELVYTPGTAVACRDCILALTQQFPLALVCMVQIVDRDGWQNIFLPGLRQAGLYVMERGIDVDCDVAANAMMKRGGSLDRFDFGICYISRTKF